MLVNNIQNRRRSRGFSLTETMMVLAVGLVLMAIGVPKLASAMNGYRLREATSNVAGELNVAKLQATSQAVPYQVAITSSSYQLNAMTSTPGTLPRTFALATGQESVPLPSNIVFSTAGVTTSAGDTGEQGTTAPVQAAAITFNSLGLPVDSSGNPNQQNAFYLYNTATKASAAVTVSLSGRILAWEWSGSAWVQQ
jgi:prepilin-type N-terminal cleavage/methylation domain-containing protein